VTVGRLGRFDFTAGLYVYVGSAFGPGGLAARVGRHLRSGKRLRWHIDYLTCEPGVRTVATITRLQTAAANDVPGICLECDWVRCLLAIPGVEIPARGFGASDCREDCPAHLLRLPDGYDHERLWEVLGE
jgi:Uri superfamily endonuclease